MDIKNVPTNALLDSEYNPSVTSSSTDILEVHEDQRATVLIKDIINFKNTVGNLLKADVKSQLTENAISFNDITERLIPNNLNLETGVFITPVLGQESSFNPSEGFHGFAEIKTKPLEEVVIDTLSPSNFVRGEGVLVQADLVNSAGIGQLTIKNIALNDKAAYIITQEDVETFNSAETNFIELDLTNISELIVDETTGKQSISSQVPTNTFGASKLYLNVPLVANKEFTVNANNLGATLTPAGIPVNLDGTESSNKEGYGALGYKAITLNADLTQLGASQVLKTATSGGGTLTPGGVSIGFSAVSIPDLTPQIYELTADQHIDGTTGNISLTSENVAIYNQIKYTLNKIPQRSIDIGDFIIHSISSRDYINSTKLNFLPNGSGSGDACFIGEGETNPHSNIQAITEFTMTLPGQYNPVIEATTISSLIATGCSSIVIDSSGVTADGKTLDSNDYGNTKTILSQVQVQLPTNNDPKILIASDFSVSVNGTRTGIFYMEGNVYINKEITSSFYFVPTTSSNSEFKITRYSSSGAYKLGVLTINATAYNTRALELYLEDSSDSSFSFKPTLYIIEGTSAYISGWSVKFYDPAENILESIGDSGSNISDFNNSTAVKNFFNLEPEGELAAGKRITDSNLHLFMTSY